jgi:hypothetical protein
MYAAGTESALHKQRRDVIATHKFKFVIIEDLLFDHFILDFAQRTMKHACFMICDFQYTLLSTYDVNKYFKAARGHLLEFGRHFAVCCYKDYHWSLEKHLSNENRCNDFRSFRHAHYRRSHIFPVVGFSAAMDLFTIFQLTAAAVFIVLIVVFMFKP